MDSHSIIRSDDLRAENRHRILRSLRRDRPRSRAALAKITGLSAASVSTLISDLASQGIVSSSRALPSGTLRRGRPQNTIALSESAGAVVTLALTIDRIQVCLVDYSGVTLEQQETRIQSRELDQAELLENLQWAIQAVLNRRPEKKLKHIGIGFQGVINHSTGDLLWSPILGVQQIPIRPVLQNAFSVAVNVNNDCRLIAEALYHLHADTLGESFAAILFSHGVGMGLYLNGQPFSGTQSSALELGHVQHISKGALCRCGKRGCIEAYAADYGIDRAARGQQSCTTPAGYVSKQRMQEITQAALTGNQNARHALIVAGNAIGEGLGNVFTLLDPMPVALIGRSADGFDLMMEGLCDAIRRTNRVDTDLVELIHCFNEDDPLLQSGLALDTLASLDRQFAYNRVEPATHAEMG